LRVCCVRGDAAPTVQESDNSHLPGAPTRSSIAVGPDEPFTTGATAGLPTGAAGEHGRSSPTAGAPSGVEGARAAQPEKSPPTVIYKKCWFGNHNSHDHYYSSTETVHTGPRGDTRTSVNANRTETDARLSSAPISPDVGGFSQTLHIPRGTLASSPARPSTTALAGGMHGRSGGGSTSAMAERSELWTARRPHNVTSAPPTDGSLVHPAFTTMRSDDWLTRIPSIPRARAGGPLAQQVPMRQEFAVTQPHRRALHFGPDVETIARADAASLAFESSHARGHDQRSLVPRISQSELKTKLRPTREKAGGRGLPVRQTAVTMDTVHTFPRPHKSRRTAENTGVGREWEQLQHACDTRTHDSRRMRIEARKKSERPNPRSAFMAELLAESTGASEVNPAATSVGSDTLGDAGNAPPAASSKGPVILTRGGQRLDSRKTWTTHYSAPHFNRPMPRSVPPEPKATATASDAAGAIAPDLHEDGF
jgi:hypothetical protein